MSDHVRVSVSDGVCRIQMHRPEKKNALTREMYAALAHALERAASDDAIRAVLLTGTGDSFTAGNDIADFRGAGRAAGTMPDAPGPSRRFYLAVTRCPKPVVAAVNGLAIGIGTTILLHCDLVYAAAEARFRMPFVDLGLVPELGSSLLLPRLAGRHRAAELLLLGDFFPATVAAEIGLVTRVVPADELEALAAGVAAKLARKPAGAMRETKALLRLDTNEVMERMDRESVVFARQLATPETQAVLAGVLTRRTS